ncbi:hypothetical protein M011DRAFT_16640 [Sporormia fimetaria CBS 119925]|uniref:Uncharacterized protein n=1 Tax=Sporormia fimetaria CBS 119925 TaxID=1340428 RepID=A0A6A6VS62_9PLEO|nr:hypothetical protein M011DRAFT_16640 [Sporormia fimetaria CBS 119925]
MANSDRNNANQNTGQWTHIPYTPQTTSPRSTSSMTTSSSTASTTASAGNAQGSSLTIHQYRPQSPQNAGSKYPVTGPFLTPQMPRTWPVPGQQQGGANSGGNHAGNGGQGK